MDNSADYIRLGLAVKTTWPDIDFETVEIHAVPFGKDSFEVPVMTEEVSWRWPEDARYAPLLKKETVDMHRFYVGEAEFMVGYSFGKWLVGIKE